MLTFEEKKAHLAECNPSAYLFDGFENAMIGVVQQFSNPVVAGYDYDKCIEILMTRDKMSEEDAIEFFEFNTTGCGLGPNTPAIIKQL